MSLDNRRITSLAAMIVNHLWNCPPDELCQCNCGSLAKVLRMHPVVLSRRFSREYGRPLVTVLREIKVVRAVGMLRYGKVASVDEAMVAAGYRDRKYFETLVRHQFGISWGDLQQLHTWDWDEGGIRIHDQFSLTKM
ncbi:MAG TPA: AraC family transcriptional regulator [Candidatus Aminicenantes bacterium]|nr:AraC family transcriptional regulator [Candidatus Aminicenantes bacterium]